MTSNQSREAIYLTQLSTDIETALIVVLSKHAIARTKVLASAESNVDEAAKLRQRVASDYARRIDRTEKSIVTLEKRIVSASALATKGASGTLLRESISDAQGRVVEMKKQIASSQKVKITLVEEKEETPDFEEMMKAFMEAATKAAA